MTVNDAEHRLGGPTSSVFRALLAVDGRWMIRQLNRRATDLFETTNTPGKLVPAARQLVSKRLGWLRLSKAILNCLARRTLVPRRLIAGVAKRLRRNFLDECRMPFSHANISRTRPSFISPPPLSTPFSSPTTSRLSRLFTTCHHPQ